jgi:hypothetical protein
MKRFIAYTAMTIMCLTSQVSFAQGLLGKLDVEGTDTASEIFDSIIKPIAMFDPEFVEVKVLDDLEIFKGHSDDIYPPESLASVKDGPMLFNYLHAMNNELLLKVNVQVNLKEAFYKSIHTTLSRLADTERLLNGKSLEEMKIGGDFNVGFFVGSIKGTPRIHVEKSKGVSNYERINYPQQVMGFENIETVRNNSNHLHEPFTYYGFSRIHNNGKLCKTVAYNYANTTKDTYVYDEYMKNVKPAAQDYFQKIYPVINMKFLSNVNSIVNEDTIIFDPSIDRMGSIMGFGSADLNRGINRNEYQSMVTIDPVNGWHPQDAMDMTSPSELRFAKLVKIMHIAPYFGGNQGVLCQFGIAKQINFSIVTKVTKDILGKTERIVVDFEPRTEKHVTMFNDLHRDRMLIREKLDLESNKVFKD